MRFIVMHKVDAKMEAGGPPSPEIIEKMGELVQSSLRSGVFLNAAGLHRSAARARLKSKAVTQPSSAGAREIKCPAEPPSNVQHES